MGSRKSKLDDMLDGKYPKHVLDAIEGEEMTVEEVAVWVKTRSPFMMRRSGKHLEYRFEGRVPISKVMAVIGGISGAISTLVGLIWIAIQQIEKVLELIIKLKSGS